MQPSPPPDVDALVTGFVLRGPIGGEGANLTQ